MLVFCIVEMYVDADIVYMDLQVDTSVSEKLTVSVFKAGGHMVSLRNVGINLQVRTTLPTRRPQRRRFHLRDKLQISC
jgi:hypothetical protein